MGKVKQMQEYVEEHEHELAERIPWLLPLAAGIFLGGFFHHQR